MAEILHQLRLVVYPIIYSIGFHTSQVVSRIYLTLSNPTTWLSLSSRSRTPKTHPVAPLARREARRYQTESLDDNIESNHNLHPWAATLGAVCWWDLGHLEQVGMRGIFKPSVFLRVEPCLSV